MIAFGAQLFGPVARRLICPDRWSDQYPAWPAYAKELDVLLLFADEQGCLGDFIPRLEAKNTERDEAIQELRVAYWLHHMGFPIAQWNPPGLGRMVGEYLIETSEGIKVFVEVKSPGWEGELSDAERKAGRAKQPKYREGDGGAFGEWVPLRQCIASKRTYPKFDSARPNLLVIADDLKVNLTNCPEHAKIALYADHTGYGEVGCFTSSRFENLGGVAIFSAYERGLWEARGVEYEFMVFPNPFALPTTKLPNSILRFKEKAIGIVRGTSSV